jgi:hypothetical protein
MGSVELVTARLEGRKRKRIELTDAVVFGGGGVV